MTRALIGETIPGCQNCNYAESHGMNSRRLSATQTWEEFYDDVRIHLADGPQSLDYSMGNLCNLKCVICGPKNSSAWASDFKKLNPSINIDHFLFDKHNQISEIDESMLVNLKLVHFHGGGEPLMSDAHANLLHAIRKVKGLDDVRVAYNTNGTVTVPDEILGLWGECHLVELYFSIDDIGHRFEYQRTGASWDAACTNIKWFHAHMPPNHLFRINTVWSYLNLYYLDELVDWIAQNFSNTRFGDPVNQVFQPAVGKYLLRSVDSRSKNILSGKFANYPDLSVILESLSIDDANNHADFWDTIKKLDKIRGRSFEMVHPEWSLLLK